MDFANICNEWNKGRLPIVNGIIHHNGTSLEVLYINGYSHEFDLAQLCTLKLKELHLLNCPKIINAESLLEMECLESVIIQNCKKALSIDTKQKLHLKNYLYIRI